MPKVIAATIFALLLCSLVILQTHASSLPADLTTDQQHPLHTKDTFSSGIIHIDSNFFTENNLQRYLVFGGNNAIHSNNLNSIQKIHHSNYGFFSVSLLSDRTATNLASQGYLVIKDYKLDFHTAPTTTPTIIPDASNITNLTGSAKAASMYNATGHGTTIAIVDTGVDFSNPDIQHSLARNDLNHPIMLDADGQGIILTNATFFANIDKNQIIRNSTKSTLKTQHTSSIYVNDDGVFLDISQAGNGTNIQIYNSFFPQFGSTPTFNGTLTTDIKIGTDNRNYIQSKSGIYHLGVIYQGGLTGPFIGVQVVPVLVTDAHTPGLYDTITADLSTSWLDYTRHTLPTGQTPDYDFDFTDEKPIILGSGNEFLVHDSNNDGKNDYSAGTIGTHVLDVYNAITNATSHTHDQILAVNGTLLPPLDPKGQFFGLMTDFVGHGTASAASITSKGQETYNIYNNTNHYTLPGIAPNAKIIPIKTLWLGDTVYGWLWAAGFENNNNTWEFSGHTKADIISNSWGVSNFPLYNAAPGMDILSLILSVLATPGSIHPDYPGTTMITSAGNSGHGYGTIGLPNASPLGISVGATTNNVFVGYGPFKDQPRFGNDTSHANHIVDFSSRGPGIIGDPKPDLLSIGAHGFVPANVLKQKDSKSEPFSLFGGTSMAAPLVSGSAAILIEELKKHSIRYDPFLIKNILMSTATDIHNDPLTQGAGIVNTKAALDYINGNNSTFTVHNDGSYNNIRDILNPAINLINKTAIGLEKFTLPPRQFHMSSWFAGQLLPGDRSTTQFTINNPTNDTLTVTILPQTLTQIKTVQFNGTTSVRQQETINGTTPIKQQEIINGTSIKQEIINGTDAFIPNYIPLAELGDPTDLNTFLNDYTAIPAQSSLLVLNLHFLFNDFMNDTSTTYADDIKISSLYLYDWIDANNDTEITSDELSMVNRAGSWGTVQELRVSDPNKKFDGVPIVGVYPVPTRHSYWLGDTKLNSTAMDYTITANYYQKNKWSAIWSGSDTVVIPPNDTADIDVTLIAPTNSKTGVHQGFLKFESDKDTEVNIPVSFAVKHPVPKTDHTIFIPGDQTKNTIYGNGYTKGAFNMIDRYMAGDWRQYYFDIQDDTINTAAVKLSWQGDNTSLSVFVAGPTGQLVQTNVPSGVFGHFLGWPSTDWLGSTPFSEGGGFFPVSDKGETSTVLHVPINQTGTYTVLTHATLFEGLGPTEPITLGARFSTIPEHTSREKLPLPVLQQQQPKNFQSFSPVLPPSQFSLPALVVPPPPQTAPPTPPQTAPPTPPQTAPPTPPQTAPPTPPQTGLIYQLTPFDTGLILGLTIGILLGSALFVSVRTKSKKKQGL